MTLLAKAVVVLCVVHSVVVATSSSNGRSIRSKSLPIYVY